MQDRVFTVSSFLIPSSEEPKRNVITESRDAAVVAWYILPGQHLAAHVHPDGQDTWTVMSGSGEYHADTNGKSVTITAGDVAVAHRGQVHGVVNNGSEPLVVVAVVCPPASGFEPVPTGKHDRS